MRVVQLGCVLLHGRDAVPHVVAVGLGLQALGRENEIMDVGWDLGLGSKSGGVSGGLVRGNGMGCSEQKAKLA